MTHVGLKLWLGLRRSSISVWHDSGDHVHGGGKGGADHLADLPVCMTHHGTFLFHLNDSPLPDFETHPYSTAPQTVISKPKVRDF